MAGIFNKNQYEVARWVIAKCRRCACIQSKVGKRRLVFAKVFDDRAPYPELDCLCNRCFKKVFPKRR